MNFSHKFGFLLHFVLCGDILASSIVLETIGSINVCENLCYRCEKLGDNFLTYLAVLKQETSNGLMGLSPHHDPAAKPDTHRAVFRFGFNGSKQR